MQLQTSYNLQKKFNAFRFFLLTIAKVIQTNPIRELTDEFFQKQEAQIEL